MPTDYDLAEKAIVHILTRISKDGRVSWYMGHATESYALLCTALAEMRGCLVDDIEVDFPPARGENPADITKLSPREESPEKLGDTDFFARMEKELQANIHQGDWRTWKPDRLACLEEFWHHIGKLRKACKENRPDLVYEFCADIANIAMKTAEVHGEPDEE